MISQKVIQLFIDKINKRFSGVDISEMGVMSDRLLSMDDISSCLETPGIFAIQGLGRYCIWEKPIGLYSTVEAEGKKYYIEKFI